MQLSGAGRSCSDALCELLGRSVVRVHMPAAARPLRRMLSASQLHVPDSEPSWLLLHQMFVHSLFQVPKIAGLNCLRVACMFGRHRPAWLLRQLNTQSCMLTPTVLRELLILNRFTRLGPPSPCIMVVVLIG